MKYNQFYSLRCLLVYILFRDQPPKMSLEYLYVEETLQTVRFVIDVGEKKSSYFSICQNIHKVSLELIQIRLEGKSIYRENVSNLITLPHGAVAVHHQCVKGCNVGEGGRRCKYRFPGLGRYQKYAPRPLQLPITPPGAKTSLSSKRILPKYLWTVRYGVPITGPTRG